MKYIYGFLLAFLAAHNALASDPPKGKVDGATYGYNEIGWSFNIPDGWSVRSAEEIARARGVGKQAFQETLKQDVPLTPTPLLYLSSGKNNRFTSDAVVYTQSRDEYEANQDRLSMQLQEVYRSKGIKISSNKRKTSIDNIGFIVYDTHILTPDGKKVLAKSSMFTSLVGDIDFTMSYTCVDRNECKQIESSILGSSFAK